VTHSVEILYPVKPGVENLPAVAFLAVYILTGAALTATVSTELLTGAVHSVYDAPAALLFGTVSCGVVSCGVVSCGAVSYCCVSCSAVLRAADFRDIGLAGDTLPA
jgi:hypothetical protein